MGCSTRLRSAEPPPEQQADHGENGGADRKPCRSREPLPPVLDLVRPSVDPVVRALRPRETSRQQAERDQHERDAQLGEQDEDEEQSQTEEGEPADDVDDPADDASTTVRRNSFTLLCHHSLLGRS